ncbi:hypothetical protein C8J56DRAFT_1039171 [Mycena floridula]|nr:hypothetical protein C8J56DRAFT_1039171 [Mycena floridula]
MKAVKELKACGCLHGDATLEEVLNPFIEQEDADMEEITFQDGNAGIAKIVSLVQHHQAIAKSELIVDEVESDGNKPCCPEVMNKEIIEEFACLEKPDLPCNLELTHNLCLFQAHTCKEHVSDITAKKLEELANAGPVYGDRIKHMATDNLILGGVKFKLLDKDEDNDGSEASEGSDEPSEVDSESDGEG